MDHRRFAWASFSFTLLALIFGACERDAPCKTPGAVRIQGVCDCPEGSPYDKGRDSCVVVDGGALDGTVPKAEEGVASSSRERDARMSAEDRSSPEAGPPRSGNGTPSPEQHLSDAAAAASGCVGAAGRVVCDGAALVSCDAAGAAALVSTCESEELCRIGLTRGSCATCAPGSFKCDGKTLQQCSTDGAAWRFKEECDSADLCNETGACTDRACAADAFVCEGDRLLRCNARQTGFEEVEVCGPGRCDASGKQCDLCAPNTSTCDGSGALKACDSTGQKLTRTACPSSTPVCAGEGRCVQCGAASDCGPVAECKQATCDVGPGSCGTKNAPAGTKCSAGVCDGSGSCVNCLSDAECGGATPVCSSGSCLVCTPMAGCSPDRMCQSGRCVPKPHCGDGIVQAGEECDSSDRWACTSTCKKSSGVYTKCEVQSDGTRGTCPNGLICFPWTMLPDGSAEGTCAVGCSAGCPPPPAGLGSGAATMCYLSGVCIATCVSHFDCPSGLECLSGNICRPPVH